MNSIDSILNRITMYRLVLYYLIALLVYAGILAFFHVLSFTPTALAFTTIALIASCYIGNKVLAYIFGAVTSSSSAYITALILALIITPVSPHNIAGAIFLGFVAVWAMASKYLLSFRGKHIFNPAAFAVALSALVLNQGATWWVAGNLAILPVLLIGGLLLVRKMQRFDLVVSFAVAALVTIALTMPANPFGAMWTTLLHSAFFFLAFVMLTEPATMPPSRWERIVYGIIVGIWFAPAMHIGSFYFTPELALLLGNLFVFFIAPRGRLMLTLQQRNKLADGVYEFVFTPDHKLNFTAGQYLEWTVKKDWTDSRGNRRYFTIASSPTEKEIRLGVKFYKPLSTFKKVLLGLKPGDTITASHLSGEFTLPKSKKAKMVFIAGGIGVTPFRAMLQNMLDTKDARPTTLFYSNKTAQEIAYIDLLERARTELGIKTIYALTNEPAPVDGAYMGFVDAALIQREVPDYLERTFYLSGPRGMVLAFETTLHDLGIPHSHIKTDYFPGFV